MLRERLGQYFAEREIGEHGDERGRFGKTVLRERLGDHWAERKNVGKQR